MRIRRHLLCAGLATLAYACSPGPEELERTSDSFQTREPEVDCATRVDPPGIGAEWRDVAGEPLPGGVTRLAITDRKRSAADVEVRFRLEADRTYRWSERLLVNRTAELRVPLAELELPSGYSSQLLADVVVLSPAGVIIEKASATPVYLHRDRESRALRIYSEELLVTRYHGGDLDRRMKGDREEVGGVGGEIGLARNARAEDLFGDPDDARREGKEAIR